MKVKVAGLVLLIMMVFFQGVAMAFPPPITAYGDLSNTFLGTGAGTSIIGTNDTFVGAYAGQNDTTGSNNSFFGYTAGYYCDTGSNNTFIGEGAGYNNNGSGNVLLGFSAGASENGSNKLYIDNCYTGGSGCTSPLIYGEFDNRIVRIDGTLIMGPPPVMISDGRLKQDVEPLKSSLEKITRLRGVSFNWKPEKMNYAKGFGGKKQIGLIAQEVEAIFPELVYTDAKGLKAVAYDKLGPLVIEAIKEQEKKIEEKDAQIERLEKALAAVEQRLASLENPAKTVAIK